MKVMQIMPEFGLAGAERMCEALCLGLKEAGDEVRAVSFFDYRSVITDNLEAAKIQVDYLGKKRGLDLAIVPRLRAAFMSFKPDIIHTHRYCLKYVQFALRTTTLCTVCVHTVHNVAEHELSNADKRPQGFFFRRKWAVPVAISPLVRDSIEQLYLLDPDDVPMIFNGVSRCFPPRDRHDDEFRFLHIGRYTSVKNHELLVKAFSLARKSNPRISLDLVGTGELFETIKELIAELGLEDSVHQVGLIDDVTPCFAKADAFVLPSNYEGMPISLVEAQAAGLPSIVTPVGGVPDVVSEGVEALYCKPTVDSVAHSLLMLAGDAALTKRMGAAALANSMRFTQKSMTDQYRTLYKSLISSEANDD